MRNKLLSFYFLVLLLYSAQPCRYTMISESATNILFAIFPFFLSIYVASKQKLPLFNKKILMLYSILTIWNGVQFFLYKVQPSPYPYICLYCGYVGFYVFREVFFEKYIDTVFKLSVLSLVVYLITVVATSSVATFISNYGIDMTVSKSFVIVNICTKINDGIIRNPGFCWEPGRFACFLVFAIAFFLFRNGMNLKDRKFCVIVVALISTFSTTGYAAFIFIIIYWNLKGRKFNPLYMFIVLIIVSTILELPFMRDKISSSFVTQDDVDIALNQLEWSLQNGKGDNYYAPQRFQGLMLQWINFQHMPVLCGASRNINLHYLNNQMGYKLSLSEGNLGVIVRYGLIVGMFLYYNLIKSSKKISLIFDRNVKYLILGLFLFVNFSYYFWETPIFIIMWTWSYFYVNKENSNLICNENSLAF